MVGWSRFPRLRTPVRYFALGTTATVAITVFNPNAKQKLNQYWSENKKSIMIYGMQGSYVGIYGLWKLAGYKALHYDDGSLLHWMTKNFMCSFINLRRGRWHTLLTSIYSHKDLWHLIPNSFVLHYLGNWLLRQESSTNSLPITSVYDRALVALRPFEKRKQQQQHFSELEFFGLYHVAGALASFASVAVRARFGSDMLIPTLGASGGLLALYSSNCLLRPYERNTGFIFNLRNDQVLWTATAFSIVGAIRTHRGSAAAADHIAHLTGLAVGYGAFKLYRKVQD